MGALQQQQVSFEPFNAKDASNSEYLDHRFAGSAWGSPAAAVCQPVQLLRFNLGLPLSILARMYDIQLVVAGVC
jgi:hypothetical protein